MECLDTMLRLTNEVNQKLILLDMLEYSSYIPVELMDVIQEIKEYAQYDLDLLIRG